MIDCACVIHGDMYSFDYVDKLYRGIERGLGQPFTLHVYTEAKRDVPEPYVKHSLKDMRKYNCKRGWWYKTQLFDRKHFNGQLLYFDLDVAIVGDISWLLDLSTKYFWGCRDFRHLFNPNRFEMNSSVMYFNTDKFNFVWGEFKKQPESWMRQLHGDQDFINRMISPEKKKYLDIKKVRSWRWELFDGGYDTVRRKHYNPGSGTKILDGTSIAVFHGKPKIHEIRDDVIKKYWN